MKALEDTRSDSTASWRVTVGAGAMTRQPKDDLRLTRLLLTRIRTKKKVAKALVKRIKLQLLVR